MNRSRANLSLHIFRRDLRLEDNTALRAALADSEKVIPCFILDERQLKDNPYRSDNALQFMFHSLKELDSRLREKNSRLYIFKGKPHEVVSEIISSLDIRAVYVNKDYTPFSIERDGLIRQLCKRKGIEFLEYPDTLINEPDQVLKEDRTPYTVFSPYLKKARQMSLRPVQESDRCNYFNEAIPSMLEVDFLDKLLPEKNRSIFLEGGRAEGLRLLGRLERLKGYENTREIPSVEGTSFLSAHLKFGTVSIREVYSEAEKILGIGSLFINELYWRDFFTQVAYHFPHVFSKPFRKRYSGIRWSDDERLFRTWREGMTGFPVVDAGMRQLNTTGWMHNRVRMITASFLVKDLHIDWRRGEKYFAQKLVDYDPSVNNGNWQWAASTGCDAQPYFRIFNPWRQQERYDKDCIYIKRWVPELKELEARVIHDLWKKRPDGLDYQRPIVDHKSESEKAKAMFAMAANDNERYPKLGV